jgi:transcription antitermination factor NusG
MKFPWFAVQVRTRGEALVEAQLHGKAYETFLPTYLECRQYSDRIKTVDAALFPGYLFCRCDPEYWLPILKTPGVQRVVSFGDLPVPVDESEIDTIQTLVRAPGAARPWPYLKTGDRVRVEFGAFSGVEGILVSEKGTDRLVVSVTLLQRSVAVDIDRTWVRPIQWSGYFNGRSVSAA